jgi:hypothetical protein
LVLGVLVSSPAVAAGGGSSAAELLRAVDELQQNVGDWRSVVYLEQREPGRDPLVYETVSMRRSGDRQFLILFTKPKSVAGQGYLRLDRNLWFYDPSVGRWERRTERERIGGTGSRRSDFDEWHFSDEYNPQDAGNELVGQRRTRRLILTAKPGVDTAFPIIHLWIDEDTKTVLKRQEHALSGRLMRTTYYPKWERVHSPSKKADVWYPKEIRLYDELEAGKSTLILIRDVDAKPLESNIFTKAWMEHQSR